MATRKEREGTAARLSRKRIYEVGQAEVMEAVQAQQAPEVLRALARRKQHIDEARHDINAFIEYCFTRPDGRRQKQGRIHREWQRLADQHPRLIIVAPRLHLKTFEFAIYRPLYAIGRNADEMIKIVCQADKKARKRLASIRAEMANNDDLHAVFPHLDTERCTEINKTQITVERDSRSPDASIEALGVTSSASGDRATGIVADDVSDRRNAITLPKIRESIKTAWDDWVNLLPPGRGWIHYICTLWHKKDLTHFLMANPAYAVAWYEIVRETMGSYVRLPDGTERRSPKPLWGTDCEGPWTRAALRNREKEFTPRQFARGFCNRPMDDAEAVIDKNWVHYYEGPQYPDGWEKVVSYDTASTSGAESDYTGVAIGAVHPEEPLLYVADMFHLRIKFPDKVALVNHLQKVLGPEFHIVERAGGGIELMDHIEEEQRLLRAARKLKRPIIMRGMRPQGTNKRIRLESISPYLKSAQIKFHISLKPNPDELDEDDRGDGIDEIVNFGTAGTDDILDAVCHMARFVTRVYEVFSPAEDDWDEDDEDDEDDDEGGGVLIF